MEEIKYSESRISVLIDARKADKAFWESLTQFINRTKQDLEFLCICSEDLTHAYHDLILKGKLKLLVNSTGAGLNPLFSQLLNQASGSVSILTYQAQLPSSNLLQQIQNQKKQLHEGTLYAVNQLQTVKGNKSNKSWPHLIANSFVRLFSPIDLRDAGSGIFIGKTSYLNARYKQELGSGENSLQTQYLASMAGLPLKDFAAPSDQKPGWSAFKLIMQICGARLQYFFKDSLWQLKNIPQDWSNGNHPIYRMAFAVMALVAIFSMPILSQDFGSTWDEKAHNEYAQLSYNYLTTFGADTAAIAESKGAADFIRQAYRFYGEQMNTVAAFAYNWLGTGVYETRHLINSIYGLIGILFTSLLAFQLAGWRAAFMALLFMFFNPGWMGHSMNNPTDIPFAMGFAIAGYYLVKVMRSLPKPRFRDLVWLAVGIGMGIASRVGAFLLIAYLGLFLGVNWLDKIRRKEKNTGTLIMPYAKIVLIVAVLSYVIGISLWPYALENPLKHPFMAFIKASENAFYTNNVELFEGKRMYMITAAPWYYVFKFLGMGNPLYLVAGVLLSIVLYPLLRKKLGDGQILMLLFMLFFPILYAEYSNINYYNGWRHYMFLIPAAVPLAAVVYDHLLSLKKAIAIPVALILLVAFAKPTLWIIQNHPNQYVYFNELTGGLKGAYGNYETDYYSNSCRELAEWIAKQHPSDTLIIGINNETTTAAYWANQINPNLRFVWTREWEEQKQRWDYLILTTRTFSKNELQNGSFPPKGTVYTVMAEGVPLAAVIKRENYYMPQGYDALDKMQYDSAIYYFEQSVKYAPADEESWRMLGFSLINRPGSLDSAEKMLLKAIEIYPENFSAYSNLGLVYFNKKEFKRATEAFAKSTGFKENVSESWYYSALAYLNLGDYPNAIHDLEMAKKHNANIPEVYYYLAKAYATTNSLEKASENYQIALSLNDKLLPAWAELADVFRKLNQPDYANQCIERYKALGGQ